MSRSIHETRRTVETLKKLDVHDSAWHEEAIWLARDQLATKRMVKRIVRNARKRESEAIEVPTAPPSIVVKDEGPHTLHPLTPADMQAFLDTLPPGSTWGLESIELRLNPDPPTEEDLDPYFHRYPPWGEWEPGIWAPEVLGRCFESPSRIHVYGLVYTGENTPMLPMRTHLLRLEALTTLLHELAHHFDFTVRRSSPRWATDSTSTFEDFARASEQELSGHFVVPFLRQRFPDETAVLLSWIEQQTGLKTDLARFARSQHRQFGGLLDAARDLISDVLAGRDLVERRIDFARNLHYGEDYDLALEVCDAVLGDFPGHAGALALEGDIYFEAWIRAVSFEAAHAIGHPEEAATLSKTQIAALQHLGGRSWVERLVNEYGLHPSSPRLARRAAQLDRRERDERYTWRR